MFRAIESALAESLYDLTQIPSQDFVEVKDCVRCKSEECDRRFCFEVELVTPVGK